MSGARKLLSILDHGIRVRKKLTLGPLHTRAKSRDH